MKCGFCNYEFTLTEIQSSSGCPRCAEAKQRDQQLGVPRPLSSVVSDAVAQYPGAQPVVVVDVNMSIGAMVKFMVKWALAAIPAVLILMLIAWGAASLLSLLGRALA